MNNPVATTRLFRTVCLLLALFVVLYAALLPNHVVAIKWETAPSSDAFPAPGEWSDKFSKQGVQGTVYSSASSGNTLFLGGSITSAGGLPVKSIVQWDTLSKIWIPLGEGLNGPVYALHVVGNSLYVGGKFTTAGNIAVNNIARWDISTRTWSALRARLATK